MEVICFYKILVRLIYLNFLYENDITFAAQLISFNKKKPSICYKWIEGKTPRLGNLVKNQVIEALICLKIVAFFCMLPKIFASLEYLF